MKQPTVSVVIPNWNGKKYLKPCINSLLSQSYKDFEIIVVDNGSVDGSAEYLKANYPSVVILRNEKNRGFTGGVNKGILHSKAKYVALLNNDAVADVNWLKNLVNAMQTHPKAFATTSKILKKQKQNGKYLIDSTGDFYSRWGLAFPRGRDEVDSGQYDDKPEILAASGGASIYRRELFASVGVFEQSFFAYFEDVDISLRAILQGYKIYYQPSAVVYHEVGATSGGGQSKFSRYHSMKNVHFLYWRVMPFWVAIKNLPRFLLFQILAIINSIKNRVFLAHMRALCVVLLYSPYTLIKRWQIRLKRTIAPKDFEGMLYQDLPPLQHKTIRKFLRIK